MDTNVQECTECHTETDCINGLCQECAITADTALCNTCGGYGEVKEDCAGGAKIHHACEDCGGTGKMKAFETQPKEEQIVRDFRSLCALSINPDLYSALVDEIIPAVEQSRGLIWGKDQPKKPTPLERCVIVKGEGSMANAKLIAAAPELLAVVKPLLEAYCNMTQTISSDCQFIGDQLTQEAEAAIAKATN